MNERLAEAWLVWLRDIGNRQPTTLVGYAGVAVSYLDDCVGSRHLDEVPVEDVEAWLLRPRGRRAKGGVGSPATRARNVAVLKSFYKWLTARGHVHTNLGDQLVAPTVHNRNPQAIPDGTWLRAWRCADTDQELLVLGLGFFLGLRRAEIAGLHRSNIDPHTRQVVRFVRKGGGDAFLPYGDIFDVWDDFMPELWGSHGRAALQQPLEADGLEGPLARLRGPDSVNKLVLRLLERASLDRAFTPHALRHSFVTNLLRCGMPIEIVAELANHSSLAVTKRYVQVSGGRVAEWRQGALGRLGQRPDQDLLRRRGRPAPPNEEV